jgi:cyclophilin family peptidyl-prolyl cis-trans isomerase
MNIPLVKIIIGIGLLLGAVWAGTALFGGGKAASPPADSVSLADAFRTAATLDMSGQGFTALPEFVLQRTDVEELDISDNALSGALPAEIRRLSRLRKLNASGNRMTGIPAEIGQLAALEDLDFSDNALTGLPLELGNLRKLKRLDLSGNAVSDIDLAAIRSRLPSDTRIITDAAPLFTVTTSTAMEFNAGKQYTAVLHTDKGDIEIALNAGQTPNTVKNFVELSRKGFYNGTIFHRVIKGFMIQGGDPEGDGTGGPGYRFDDEPFGGEYNRGTVAMANAGPNTNGSQFFIMHSDYPLPKNYVIFGHVAQGMDAVDAIAESPVTRSASGELSRPVSPAVVATVDIREE